MIVFNVSITGKLSPDMCAHTHFVGVALICSFQKSPRKEETAINGHFFLQYRSFNSLFSFLNIRSPTKDKRK